MSKVNGAYMAGFRDAARQCGFDPDLLLTKSAGLFSALARLAPKARPISGSALNRIRSSVNRLAARRAAGAIPSYTNTTGVVPGLPGLSRAQRVPSTGLVRSNTPDIQLGTFVPGLA